MPVVNPPNGLFVFLQRNPEPGRQSNYDAPIQASPGIGNLSVPGNAAMFSYGFYEQTYQVGPNIVAGPMEWIILPDTLPHGVTLTFPGSGGVARLEMTCSPPRAITGDATVWTPFNIGGAVPLAMYPNWPTIAVPVVVPFDPPGDISDAFYWTVGGPTAIRVNLLGGACTISVRCD
jgi:hypothetical protein